MIDKDIFRQRANCDIVCFMCESLRHMDFPEDVAAALHNLEFKASDFLSDGYSVSISDDSLTYLPPNHK